MRRAAIVATVLLAAGTPAWPQARARPGRSTRKPLAYSTADTATAPTRGRKIAQNTSARPTGCARCVARFASTIVARVE